VTPKIREATFALRVVRRSTGDAAILYRRTVNDKLQERLTRVGAIGPMAYTAGLPLLRSAAVAMWGSGTRLKPGGKFYPLDPDWGARVACYALVASGLRNASRLFRAAENLRHADGAEAAWWLGLMRNGSRGRAIRALRILVEAVK